MIDAHRQPGAAREPRAHRCRQLEAQEMHRRGLLVVLALQILVGDGVDALAARDLRPDALFDAAQEPEHAAALGLVRIFDQHRRLPVGAVRDQRVVGVELALDPRLLEDALDAQHLLHLVADGELVLELQQDALAKVDIAALLVLDDLGAEFLALPRVRLERQQAVSGDHAAILRERPRSPRR